MTARRSLSPAHEGYALPYRQSSTLQGVVYKRKSIKICRDEKEKHCSNCDRCQCTDNWNDRQEKNDNGNENFHEHIAHGKGYSSENIVNELRKIKLVFPTRKNGLGFLGNISQKRRHDYNHNIAAPQTKYNEQQYTNDNNDECRKDCNEKRTFLQKFSRHVNQHVGKITSDGKNSKPQQHNKNDYRDEQRPSKLVRNDEAECFTMIRKRF